MVMVMLMERKMWIRIPNKYIYLLEVCTCVLFPDRVNVGRKLFMLVGVIQVLV